MTRQALPGGILEAVPAAKAGYAQCFDAQHRIQAISPIAVRPDRPLRESALQRVGRRTDQPRKSRAIAGRGRGPFFSSFSARYLASLAGDLYHQIARSEDWMAAFCAARWMQQVEQYRIERQGRRFPPCDLAVSLVVYRKLWAL